VRYEDERPAFINESRKKIEDFLPGARIEITCRLIGQNHVGIIDKSPRQRRPLGFPTGQLTWSVRRSVQYAQTLQQAQGLLPPLPFGLRAVEQRRLYIFDDTHLRNEIERLEEKAYPLVTNSTSGLVIEPGNVVPFKENPA
jgi:hypothetical protein